MQGRGIAPFGGYFGGKNPCDDTDGCLSPAAVNFLYSKRKLCVCAQIESERIKMAENLNTEFGQISYIKNAARTAFFSYAATLGCGLSPAAAVSAVVVSAPVVPARRRRPEERMRRMRRAVQYADRRQGDCQCYYCLHLVPPFLKIVGLPKILSTNFIFEKFLVFTRGVAKKFFHARRPERVCPVDLWLRIFANFPLCAANSLKIQIRDFRLPQLLGISGNPFSPFHSQSVPIPFRAGALGRRFFAV